MLLLLLIIKPFFGRRWAGCSAGSRLLIFKPPTNILSVTVTNIVWEQALWISLCLHASCHCRAGSHDCIPGQLHQATVPSLPASVPPVLQTRRWLAQGNTVCCKSYLENKYTTERKCLKLTRNILYIIIYPPPSSASSSSVSSDCPQPWSDRSGSLPSQDLSCHIFTPYTGPWLLQPAMSPACPAEYPDQSPALWAECSQFTLFSWCRPHFPPS